MFNMTPLDDGHDGDTPKIGWNFTIGTGLAITSCVSGIIFTTMSFFDNPEMWRWSSFSWMLAFFGFVISILYAGDSDDYDEYEQYKNSKSRQRVDGYIHRVHEGTSDPCPYEQCPRRLKRNP